MSQNKDPIPRSPKFLLVLFVDDPGDLKSIDIVPAHWVFFDEEADHLVTPFISTSNADDIRTLTALIKAEGETLSVWETHRISIKGRATTIAEAERKLKDLEIKSHVFSTDNESHAKSTELQLTKNYKLKSRSKNTESVQNLFDLVNDHVDDSFGAAKNIPKKTRQPEKIDSKSMKKRTLVTISTKSKPKSGEGRKRKRTRYSAATYKELRQSPVDDSSGDDTSSIRKYDTDVSSSEGAEAEGSTSDIDVARQFEAVPRITISSDINANYRCIDNTRGSAKYHSMDIASRKEDAAQFGTNANIVKPSQQPTLNPTSLCHVAASNKAVAAHTDTLSEQIDANCDVKTLIIRCYRSLCSQIGQTQGQLSGIKLRVEKQTASRVFTVSGISAVTEKYELGDQPFKTIVQFKDFDGKLKSNLSLRKEIISGMIDLLYEDPKRLVVSVREIVQTFLTRDVLLHYTAVKKSKQKGKYVLKDDTQFYHCLKDAILSQFKGNPTVPPIREKQVGDVLGAIINSAKDWDGHRLSRQTAKGVKQ